MSEQNGNIRSRALGRKGKGEELEVPEWDATVLIRPMTVREKAHLFDDVEDADPDNLKPKDQETLSPRVVVYTCHDPATGERVFSEDDLDALADMPANEIEEIVAVGMRVSGLSREAAEAGKEDS